MSAITISTRHIALIIACFLIFFYLSDTFRSTEFREKMKNLVPTDEKYNHTILDRLDKAANTVAGITSITSVAIINSLPDFLQNPKVFYAGLFGGGLSLLKYNGLFDWGFTKPIDTTTTTTAAPVTTTAAPVTTTDALVTTTSRP